MRFAVLAAVLALALLLMAAPKTAGAEAPAQRIVTLSPHLAELVCAVDACGELVAVSAFSNYPPELAKLDVIGDTGNLGYERLLALRPTRIYAWAGGTPDWQLAKLRQLGLPVTALQINSLAEVASTLQQLGNSLGHASAGAKAAARFRTGLAELTRRYQHEKKLRVFYQIETSPAYTVNAASPISQVIALCGGINVFGTLPTLSAPVSAEAILAARPDVVLHSEENDRAIRRFWSRFPDTPVSRLHNIYGINPDLLTRAGPRLLQGAEAVCAALNAARAARP